jgi:hypothetical protein
MMLIAEAEGAVPAAAKLAGEAMWFDFSKLLACIS